MSYYSYERYMHLNIDGLSALEAQKVCTKLIGLGEPFTVTTKVDSFRILFCIKVETFSSPTVWEIEHLMEELNIHILI